MPPQYYGLSQTQTPRAAADGSYILQAKGVVKPYQELDGEITYSWTPVVLEAPANRARGWNFGLESKTRPQRDRVVNTDVAAPSLWPRTAAFAARVLYGKPGSLGLLHQCGYVVLRRRCSPFRRSYDSAGLCSARPPLQSSGIQICPGAAAQRHAWRQREMALVPFADVVLFEGYAVPASVFGIAYRSVPTHCPFLLPGLTRY